MGRSLDGSKGNGTSYAEATRTASWGSTVKMGRGVAYGHRLITACASHSCDSLHDDIIRC